MQIGTNSLLWTSPVTEKHVPRFDQTREHRFAGFLLPRLDESP